MGLLSSKVGDYFVIGGKKNQIFTPIRSPSFVTYLTFISYSPPSFSLSLSLSLCILLFHGREKTSKILSFLPTHSEPPISLFSFSLHFPLLAAGFYDPFSSHPNPPSSSVTKLTRPNPELSMTGTTPPVIHSTSFCYILSEGKAHLPKFSHVFYIWSAPGLAITQPPYLECLNYKPEDTMLHLCGLRAYSTLAR